MQKINDFIKENPKMALKEISKMYGISVSAVSKRRAILGIKHETSNICKMIKTMLNLKNIDIANKLGCTQSLVAVVRHKEGKRSTQRVDLDEKQIELIRLNYNSMTGVKLAELVGVSCHVLRSRMAKMRLYNYMERESSFFDYSLDNGIGYFDLEKYKQVML
jgi:predicted transcriptional regulator